MFFSLESACTKPRQELCWGAAFHPSYFYIFGVNVDVSVPSFVRNFNPKNSSKQLNQEENESQKKQHKWRRRYKTPLSIQHVPRTWTQEGTMVAQTPCLRLWSDLIPRCVGSGYCSPHSVEGSSTSPSRARLAAQGACTSKRAIWSIGNLSLEVLLFYQIPAQNRCLRYTYGQLVPPRTGNFTDFSRT